mmetsp:Transcript_68540/g.198886  ORF Transcript_68540/g.198886 Transcript_68540/m.198886 type:complete len:251 (-) Transcript_68540:586-1338(-)
MHQHGVGAGVFAVCAACSPPRKQPVGLGDFEPGIRGQLSAADGVAEVVCCAPRVDPLHSDRGSDTGGSGEQVPARVLGGVRCHSAGVVRLPCGPLRHNGHRGLQAHRQPLGGRRRREQREHHPEPEPHAKGAGALAPRTPTTCLVVHRCLRDLLCFDVGRRCGALGGERLLLAIARGVRRRVLSDVVARRHSHVGFHYRLRVDLLARNPVRHADVRQETAPCSQSAEAWRAKGLQVVRYAEHVVHLAGCL